MRVVADTSVVVSGLLWRGAPHQVLVAARTGAIDLFTSAALLAELEDVLQRPKFARRLRQASVEPRELVLGYAALSAIVRPTAIPVVVGADPDDDHVLACASTAQAEAIVSGDSHLLDLQEYRNIPILTTHALLARLGE